MLWHCFAADYNYTMPRLKKISPLYAYVIDHYRQKTGEQLDPNKLQDQEKLVDFLKDNKDELLHLLATKKKLAKVPSATRDLLSLMSRDERADFIIGVRKQEWLDAIPLTTLLGLIEYDGAHNHKLINGRASAFLHSELHQARYQFGENDLTVPWFEHNIHNQLDTWVSELVSNSLDATVPAKMIGKFGSGFLSCFSALGKEIEHITVTTRKAWWDPYSLSFFMRNGEIVVSGERLQNSNIPQWTTVALRRNWKPIDAQTLKQQLIGKFSTNTTAPILLGDDQINNPWLWKRSKKQSLSSSTPVKVHVTDDEVVVSDEWVWMDAHDLLYHLLFPKSWSKQPKAYTDEELDKTIQSHTDYGYRTWTAGQTTIYCEVAGVVVETFHVDKQWDIDGLIIKLPSITYLPESRNQILWTKEVLLTLQSMMSGLVKNGHTLEQKLSLLWAFAHLVRHIDQRKTAEWQRQELSLSKYAQKELYPLLVKQVEQEKKTLIPNTKAIKELIGDNPSYVFVDTLFLPQLDPLTLPSVKLLDNVIAEDKITAQYHGRPLPFYSCEWSEQAPHDYVILPHCILVNQRFTQTDRDLGILNVAINLNTSYEIEGETVYYGTLVEASHPDLVKKKGDAISNKESKKEKEKIALNSPETVEWFYRNVVDKLDLEFDGVWIKLNEFFGTASTKTMLQVYLEQIIDNVPIDIAKSPQEIMTMVLRIVTFVDGFSIEAFHASDKQALFARITQSYTWDALASLIEFLYTFSLQKHDALDDELTQLLTVCAEEKDPAIIQQIIALLKRYKGNTMQIFSELEKWKKEPENSYDHAEALHQSHYLDPLQEKALSYNFFDGKSGQWIPQLEHMLDAIYNYVDLYGPGKETTAQRLLHDYGIDVAIWADRLKEFANFWKPSFQWDERSLANFYKKLVAVKALRVLSHTVYVSLSKDFIESLSPEERKLSDDHDFIDFLTTQYRIIYTFLLHQKRQSDELLLPKKSLIEKNCLYELYSKSTYPWLDASSIEVIRAPFKYPFLYLGKFAFEAFMEKANSFELLLSKLDTRLDYREDMLRRLYKGDFITEQEWDVFYPDGKMFSSPQNNLFGPYDEWFTISQARQYVQLANELLLLQKQKRERDQSLSEQNAITKKPLSLSQPWLFEKGWKLSVVVLFKHIYALCGWYNMKWPERADLEDGLNKWFWWRIDYERFAKAEATKWDLKLMCDECGDNAWSMLDFFFSHTYPYLLKKGKEALIKVALSNDYSIESIVKLRLYLNSSTCRRKWYVAKIDDEETLKTILRFIRLQEAFLQAAENKTTNIEKNRPLTMQMPWFLDLDDWNSIFLICDILDSYTKNIISSKQSDFLKLCHSLGYDIPLGKEELFIKGFCDKYTEIIQCIIKYHTYLVAWHSNISVLQVHKKSNPEQYELAYSNALELNLNVAAKLPHTVSTGHGNYYGAWFTILAHLEQAFLEYILECKNAISAMPEQEEIYALTSSSRSLKNLEKNAIARYILTPSSTDGSRTYVNLKDLAFLFVWYYGDAFDDPVDLQIRRDLINRHFDLCVDRKKFLDTNSTLLFQLREYIDFYELLSNNTINKWDRYLASGDKHSLYTVALSNDFASDVPKEHQSLYHYYACFEQALLKADKDGREYKIWKDSLWLFNESWLKEFLKVNAGLIDDMARFRINLIQGIEFILWLWSWRSSYFKDVVERYDRISQYFNISDFAKIVGSSASLEELIQLIKQGEADKDDNVTKKRIVEWLHKHWMKQSSRDLRNICSKMLGCIRHTFDLKLERDFAGLEGDIDKRLYEGSLAARLKRIEKDETDEWYAMERITYQQYLYRYLNDRKDLIIKHRDNWLIFEKYKKESAKLPKKTKLTPEAFFAWLYKKYPQDLVAFAQFLHQWGKFLSLLESTASIEQKHPDKTLRLSQLLATYNTHHTQVQDINSTHDMMNLVKRTVESGLNESWYHQRIRSAIDGQDRWSMIFLRELVQNARDAILKSSTADKNITIEFGKEGEQWITRVSDHVWMTAFEVWNYLLPLRSSGKKREKLQGCSGKDFMLLWFEQVKLE
jgi:hypothetical protein